MIIRKLFKFEGAHIVRNCYSGRCKYSIHGHSYIVEIFIKSRVLDRGGMVVDFGLLKNEVKDFIDSFDHAIALWNKDDPTYIEDMKKHSDRWIVMPVTPSAECFALLFFAWIGGIMGHYNYRNEEDVDMVLSSVRVHETATGWAEATADDVFQMYGQKVDLEKIDFSEAIIKDWKGKHLLNVFDEGRGDWKLPKPEQQVEV